MPVTAAGQQHFTHHAAKVLSEELKRPVVISGNMLSFTVTAGEVLTSALVSIPVQPVDSVISWDTTIYDSSWY
jgi:hypothetical protein